MNTCATRVMNLEYRHQHLKLVKEDSPGTQAKHDYSNISVATSLCAWIPISAALHGKDINYLQERRENKSCSRQRRKV